MLAGLATAEMIGMTKAAWSGYKGAKAVLNNVQSFRRAPEEMSFTFQLYECLLQTLEAVAEPLAIRQGCLNVVGPAVVLARSAIQRCQALMASADVDDSKKEWAEWLKAGSKRNELMMVQKRLELAISALNLALNAVAAGTLPRGFATSPFAYLPKALEDAYEALQQIEQGRTQTLLLLGGRLWSRSRQLQSGKASGARADSMNEVFQECEMRLHLGARALEDDDEDDEDDDEDDDGKAKPSRLRGAKESGRGGKKAAAAAAAEADIDTLTLSFRPTSTEEADDDEDHAAEASESSAADDGDNEGERVLVLDETVQLRRVWSHDYATELSGRHGETFLDVIGHANVLCYELRPSSATRKTASGAGTDVPLVLTGVQLASRPCHRDGKRLSAESVEALLLLALSTRKVGASKGRSSAKAAAKSIPLSDVFDPDQPAKFVSQLEMLVGPLVGVPGRPTTTSGASKSPDLTTPMRALNIA